MFRKLILFLTLFQNSFTFEAIIPKSYESIEVIYEIIKSENFDTTKIVNIFDFSNKTDKEFSKELFKAIGSEVTIEEITDFNNSSSHEKWFFNLIIIKSLKEFKSIKFADNRFNYGGYYVILYENATRKDSHEIFQVLWDFYIHNICVIRHENDTEIVETFIPFKSSECNQTNPIEIAKFKANQFIHRPTKFFSNKFKNFHQCPIKVTTFETIGPAVLKHDFPNGTYQLYGRDMEIFNTITERLNFKANIFFNSTYGGWGAINMNGDGFGAFMAAKSRGADLIFGNLNMKIERGTFLGYVSPYSADTLLFMIPPGRPLGTFEKLLRPFDTKIWLTLCFVLAFAVLIILILQLQLKGLKDLVMGSHNRTPYLNILIAMIGGSQSKLPQNNFGRFLLMIFLLFCLVMRTLYQGSLFHFLQSSDTVRDPQTIQEMAINRGYSFYMILSYSEFSSENVHMKGKVEVINPLRIKEFMTNVLDYKFQGSLLLKISQVLYSNRERAMNRQQLFKVCNEYFMNMPITMYFPKNSYLVEPFDEILLLFQQSGLINHWTSINEDMKFLNIQTSVNDPKKLTLEHLSGPFQIWLVGCIISTTAFFIEFIWFKMKSVKTKRLFFIRNELNA